jgi:hypothetical protein
MPDSMLRFGANLPRLKVLPVALPIAVGVIAEPSSPHYKGIYEKLPKEQREYPPIRADSLRLRTTLGVECPRRNEKCAKEL